MPKIYTAAVDPTTGVIDPRHKIAAAQVMGLSTATSITAGTSLAGNLLISRSGGNAVAAGVGSVVIGATPRAVAAGEMFQPLIDGVVTITQPAYAENGAVIYWDADSGALTDLATPQPLGYRIDANSMRLIVHSAADAPAAPSATATVPRLSGVGSPPMNVAATQAGVIYTDEAATNGATTWVATDNTPTGWRVIAGDTGWRDISALVTTNFQVWGSIWIRRIPTAVFVGLNNINLAYKTDTLSGYQNLVLLPDGFGIDCTATLNFSVPFKDATKPPITGAYYTAGQQLQLPVGASGDSTAGGMAILTFPASNTAWPTTLPGKAAA